MKFNLFRKKMSNDYIDILLMHDGDVFINNAYLFFLGRTPDEQGRKKYNLTLSENDGKLKVLHQLQNSKEAENIKRNKKILKSYIFRQRLKKLTLFNFGKFEAKSDKVNKTSIYVSSVKEGSNFRFSELFNMYGFPVLDVPLALSLQEINNLNPDYFFDDENTAFEAITQKKSTFKIKIFEDLKLNSEFYQKMALHYEGIGLHEKAAEVYQLSILFYPSAIAHEHLGNLALNNNKNYQAIEHYKLSIYLEGETEWVYANLASTQSLIGEFEDSINSLIIGINKNPGSRILMLKFDQLIDNYWKAEEQKLECIAVSQNREKLIDIYEKVVHFISEGYRRFFNRNNSGVISSRLNKKRVLIVGLSREAAPQCYRYRIEQKLEQLIHKGFKAETIAWYENQKALDLINFYDLIIFYRTPAFPGVVKLVEYAKSLGKLTYYELDDLLFEPISVPEIETYGGQVSMSIYTSITKDIGSHRAIAGRCHFSIASTKPLLEKLTPLSLYKTGYLHRNGFDKYNQYSSNYESTPENINIFYGSGTLAHNSDFIVEALPALEKILRKYDNVKLIIVGYLSLPESFLLEFDGKVVQRALVKDIASYWTYLAAASINLAVLHDDPLTACKSELKWFEAAAFSIPSILSRTQNYNDIIHDEYDGFIVSGVEQWYKALSRLVENPELRRVVGKRAHERVMADYSIECLSQNIESIFKESLVVHSNLIAK